MAPNLWEVIERSRQGERMEEKQFDISIFKRLQPLLKEYGIKYDPANPICPDNAMIDRIFEAAIRFYVEQGTFCTNTGRVIKFSEQELRDALAAAPSAVAFGEGADRVVMAHRGVADPETEPVVCAGIQTAPYSDEETQSTVYELCARDRCVDGIWGGLVTRVDGQLRRHSRHARGDPAVPAGYRQAARKRRRGQAGPACSSSITPPPPLPRSPWRIGKRGIRPTDPFETTGISELKIAYDDLNRSAFAIGYGAEARGAMNSVIGGMSGGPDGAVVVSVASAFQLLMVNLATSVRPGATSFSAKSRVTRDQLWVAGTALQALSRNTHLILDGCMGDHPAAGPGTHQYFWESAAGFIASTVCGGHSMGGTRKFVVSNVANFGSPLESRWMGEVCKSAASLGREEGNQIVETLLERYQGNIKTAPEGYTLWDLYDRDSLEPKDSYMAVYQEARDELSALGMKWRSWN